MSPRIRVSFKASLKDEDKRILNSAVAVCTVRSEHFALTPLLHCIQSDQAKATKNSAHTTSHGAAFRLIEKDSLFEEMTRLEIVC